MNDAFYSLIDFSERVRPIADERDNASRRKAEGSGYYPPLIPLHAVSVPPLQCRSPAWAKHKI